MEKEKKEWIAINNMKLEGREKPAIWIKHRCRETDFQTVFELVSEVGVIPLGTCAAWRGVL